jgi:uncharacterized membrane protein
MFDKIWDGLGSLHRFLQDQLLYPLLLSSLLAVGFWVGRVLLSSSWLFYRNLIWNLFLAWIPFGFSFLAAGLHLLFPRQWWMLLLPAAAWLAFFPNAPYLLTDFLHLEPRPGIPLWFDILLLASFAWSGLFLAVASLQSMHRIVRYYLGWLGGWVFAMTALGLSGLGLYLGRFSRWNSWDLVLQPKDIFVDLLYRFTNPFSNLTFFGFTMMFTAFLLVCYLTFISVRRVGSR